MPDANLYRGDNDYLCPTCGSGMILRTAHRTGNEFYGCRNFPKCRGIRNLDGSTGIGSRINSSADDPRDHDELDFDAPSNMQRRNDRRRWDS
jgi:ssDNA-binding Zn-finger/Zn-ribbon topoisomerase 1